MRKAGFATVDKVSSSDEAEQIIALLRNAGLHPVDLAAAAPLPLPGVEPEYPIQVSTEESEAAKEILETGHTYA